MAAKKSFDFELNSKIMFAQSAEKGVIIGRAHYINRNPIYLVRYIAVDGRQVESWQSEDALEA